MTERQMLVDQIIKHEGLRLRPYTDSVGKITIGVGRNLTDCGISDAEAMALLDHDLDAAVADCATFPWFAGLDGIRQRVIVDMRFNLGPVKLRQFQQTLAAVASGDYVKASDLMLKSKWARQVTTRAARLARMMATGLALLLLAAPASAQTDVVAHVKADLQARGISLSGTCGAFEITKRVAWLLRGAGWRLMANTTGENCQGFRGDKLVSTTGRFVDLLIDQGGRNDPSWQERPASPEELAVGVDPVDPGDVAAVPVPTPQPGPAPVPLPPLDLSGVIAEIQALAAQVHTDHQAIVAAVNEPGWLMRVASNRYVQLGLAVVGTYLTTHMVTQ